MLSVFRNIPVWLMLASYLFANTFAAALHDHCDGGHGHFAGQHCHGDGKVIEHDGPDLADGVHARHVCAVCEYLAHAPLAAPITAPVPAGDLRPDAVSLPVERLATAVPGTHLARGPPAS
jgi:hypothetical protein